MFCARGGRLAALGSGSYEWPAAANAGVHPYFAATHPSRLNVVGRSEARHEESSLLENDTPVASKLAKSQRWPQSWDLQRERWRIAIQHESHGFHGRVLHIGGDRVIDVSKTGADAPLYGARTEGGILMTENAACATQFGSDGGATANPSATMRMRMENE